MEPIEFILLRRPVSAQTKSRSSLQTWKGEIFEAARQVWPPGMPPESNTPLQLTIVYLCRDRAADIDNIIKPIQDALVGLVFRSDFLVSDVDSHRRAIVSNIDLTHLPSLLKKLSPEPDECVYVRVREAKHLRCYL